MKHAEAVERQVGELLRRGNTVPETARITGLPDRTVRDMADRQGIEPTSARQLPTQVVGESVLTDMIAIVADARATLANLSLKIRTGPVGDAPKYAMAYATVMKSLANIGIAKTARATDDEVAAELEFGAPEQLDFGMERVDDDEAEAPSDEDQDGFQLHRPRESARDRLLKAHAQRAAETDDPVKRLQRLGMAAGPDPGLSPGDLIRQREQQGLLADGEEEEIDRMIREAVAHGVQDE